MEVFGFQFPIAWENREENEGIIEQMLEDREIPPGSLLVFPELATAGFTMNVEKVAEAPEGASFHFFSGLAKRYASQVIAGIPGHAATGGLGANEAVCFGADGSEEARYRKIHLFPLAKEADHYAPGEAPVTWLVGDWTIAPFICYDLRFPEGFRAAAAAGANVFAVIANWPAIRDEHWVTLLKARAIENQAYVIGINRCGEDPFHPYSGASLIVSPTGEVLDRAGNEPSVLRARLDRELVESWRRDFPALGGRRLF